MGFRFNLCTTYDSKKKVIMKIRLYLEVMIKIPLLENNYKYI